VVHVGPVLNFGRVDLVLEKQAVLKAFGLNRWKSASAPLKNVKNRLNLHGIRLTGF
jgi:hypothetical protein